MGARFGGIKRSARRPTRSRCSSASSSPGGREDEGQGTDDRMQMRARALERRRLPDELDRMLTVASSPAWLGVLALAMAMAGLVVWGFLGKLPREVSAKGILSAGAQTSVESTVSGQVAGVSIATGDTVQAGQT